MCFIRRDIRPDRSAICMRSRFSAVIRFFYQGYGRVDLAGGSETAMMTSLARLMKLPDDTVCYPGHGMKTKIAWERGTQA